MPAMSGESSSTSSLNASSSSDGRLLFTTECNQFCSAARASRSRRNSAAAEDAQGVLDRRNVTELETLQPDASAANRALELLGRQLNLFTEKKEVSKPGDFDHMVDEELTEFIEAQGK